MSNRNQFVTNQPDGRHPANPARRGPAVPRAIVLSFLMAAGAMAQQVPALTDPNAVMGFETPAGWRAVGDDRIAVTAATTTRTQGSFALQLGGVAELTKLISAPVASTANALAGLGDDGSQFEVDVLLPPQTGKSEHKVTLQLFVSSLSRNLQHQLVGKADLGSERRGLYQTVHFPVPAAVKNALVGATYADLTFQFFLNSPEHDSGQYLFDNLRVHSASPVTGGVGVKPPPGFGGSVDLIAIGNAPVSKTFDVQPLQIPDSFHLKLGVAGTTSVQLDLGYTAGVPAITCLYNPDKTDTTGKSYLFISCTGTSQPGDIIGVSWAQLTILNADPLLKLRAQLAGRPVGDQVGSGIIPAMPTFWGDFDGCVVAPVKGVIVTTSPSCAAQRDQANQILNAYSTKLSQSKPAPGWIALPAPEYAKRHSDGSPYDALSGVPPPPHDPPFDQSGHMNPGGSFDAYWRLNGSLASNNFPNTNRNTAHFDATFSTHAVLFGGDVDILGINTVVDTDTGETIPDAVNPSSSGSLHLFLFGNEIPPGGFSADPASGFSVNPPPITEDYNLPPISIWIFDITLGATAQAGISASGGVAASGFDVTVTPYGSVGVHVEGGIDLGIASGGVDARIDLLEVQTPVMAQAKWYLDLSPSQCAAKVSASLNGNVTVDAGGGEVDLVASFGICPFCDDVSVPILKWDPLVSDSYPLFNVPLATQAFALPAAACTAPLNVYITDPAPQQLVPGAPYTYVPVGVASSGNGGGNISCNDFTWSVSGAGDSLTGQGCNAVLTFGPTAHQSVIGLSASHLFSNAFGNSVLETGTATPVTVNVNPLATGDYITEMDSFIGTAVYSFAHSPTLVINTIPQGPYVLFGTIVGASGPISTNWTVTDPSGTTTVTTSNDNFNPSGTIFKPVANGTYTITMTTVDGGGNTIGSSTVTVTFSPLN